MLDNTRTRDVLALDDPKLGERMAGSLGTFPKLENTLQRGNDPLVDTTTLAGAGTGVSLLRGADSPGAMPINYAPLPTLPQGRIEELPRTDKRRRESFGCRTGS